MKCPVCGREMQENARFCSHCGSILQANASNDIPLELIFADQDERKNLPAEKEAVEAAPEIPAPPLPTHSQKIKQLLRDKRVLGGIAAVVVVALVLSVFIGFLNSRSIDNGFITMQHFYSVVNDEEHGMIYDKQIIPTDNHSPTSLAALAETSIDGSVCFFLTLKESQPLYMQLNLVADKECRTIATVLSAELSVFGDSLVYHDIENKLCLYDIRSGKSSLILQSEQVKNYHISPDGKSVAYTLNEADGRHIYLYVDGGEIQELPNAGNEQLIAISNSCEGIYLQSGSRLAVCSKEGLRTELSSQATNYWFNADHTQILFWDETGTYISDKGGPAKKMTSQGVQLVLPPNAAYFNRITAPVESFFGHVYCTNTSNGTRTAYFLDEYTDACRILADYVASPTLDIYGQKLYFISLGQLRSISIEDAQEYPEKNHEDLQLVLANNVVEYAISAQTDTVYYRDNSNLYSCSTKGSQKSKHICAVYSSDTPSSGLPDRNLFATDGDGVFYYISEGDLYATDNGMPGKRVFEDVTKLMDTPAGFVYFLSRHVYVANGIQKPTLLVDTDY